MPSQLVLADLQKQIAQGVRNAYIKSFALKKKALLKEWLLSFPSTHPSHLHRKKHTRPKQKQPERELKCHNMNLRASEVVSLPFPVFRLMSIPSELISHRRKDERWQQLILLEENRSFSMNNLFREDTETAFSKKTLTQPSTCLCHHPWWRSCCETLRQAWELPNSPFWKPPEQWNPTQASAPKLPDAHLHLC